MLTRALLSLVFSAATLAAEPLSVARCFTSHMVLQRGMNIRIWGNADAGDAVRVRIAKHDAATTADGDGRWSLSLEPLTAGGPHVLEISSGDESLRLDDVLVGEVWLCAGQSNMRWKLSQCLDAAREVGAADDPHLRFFDMVGAGYPSPSAWDADTLAKCNPQDYYLDTEWRACTPETAASFSGVAYYFGKALRRRLGIPVGLIHNAIGGTCIEAYISREGLRGHELLAGAATDRTTWLDNPNVPAWCRLRGRQNLKLWLDDPKGTMPGHPFEPSFLYDAGIRPLLPLSLRGAIWYQGESNATLPDNRTAADPAHCRAGIETLIADWRRAFEQPELPFLYVQLPSMGRNWMEFREVQRRCLAIPHTGMAVALELGHASDVHPRNKRGVGVRLANVAAAQVYGADPSGLRSPMPTAWRVEGRTAVVECSDTGGGLLTRDGRPVRGFEIADARGVWHPARAVLVGDRAVLSHAAVETPTAVRYAWAPVPDANVIGGTGLPLVPFREGDAPSATPQDPRPEQEAGSTSFEEVDAGPFTKIRTHAGRWTAKKGHAVVDPAHHRTGKHCLHIVGGEDRQVVLEPSSQGGAKFSELTFWAERWTRRAPFVFRVEARSGGKWREIYRGDDKIVIGTFKTHVRIPLESSPRKLRITCTSPSGVLIDDVRLGEAKPMEVLSVTTTQPVTPILLRNPRNRVAQIEIVTRGGLKPLEVREVRIDLAGTTDLRDLAGVEILRLNGSRFGKRQAPAAELVFRDRLALVEGDNKLRISVELTADANQDHVVDAGCTRVALTGDRELEPATTHPPGAQRIGVALRRGGDDDSKAYRIPGLVTTNAGTLIGVYDIRWRGAVDLPNDIDVGMSRSTDGGRSWEPMRKILDMGDDPKFRWDGVGDPSILVDETTGTIWVASTWSHGNRAWRGSGPGLTPEETGQLILVRSDDDGLTWSDPINITAQVKKPEWCYLLQGPGRGITMRDGTIVFAAQYQDTLDNKRMPHSTILFSTDHGETWQLGATAPRANTTEAQVAELEDGVLMLNMRDNRGGSRAIYTTRDLGKTWAEHPTSRGALVEPVCNAALLRVDDKRLLFVNPAVPRAPRRRMTVKLSPDLGATWPDHTQLLIDEGRSAGYPSATMIDADTVGVLFEGSAAMLTFLRIPVADVSRR